MLERQILLRSFGLGIYCVEYVQNQESLIQSKLAVSQSIICEAGFSSSQVIAIVIDEETPERIYFACTEGHIPCELELAQLQVDIGSIMRASTADTAFARRIRMLLEYFPSLMQHRGAHCNMSK